MMSRLFGSLRKFSTTHLKQMTFEGNAQGIFGTEEERMSRVFGGRLKGEAPQSSSRMVYGGDKQIAGVTVPAKPVAPNNCCMSGCVNCVWELYNDDVKYWKKKREEAVIKIAGSDEKWPKDWNPPLLKLKMQNIPPELHTKKLQLQNHEANSKVDMSKLFPKRQGPIPNSVLEAKRRNAQKIQTAINEDEGWDDIPVYIKAFAEFERQKKLLRKKTSQ